MKNLNKSLNSISISKYLYESMDINEGFTDILKKLKEKFSNAFKLFNGFVVKVKDRFFPVDAEGNQLDASTPADTANLYKEGKCDKSIFVHPSKEVSNIVGLNNSTLDCIDKIPDYQKFNNNSIEYWKSLPKFKGSIKDFNESMPALPKSIFEELESDENTINEVKIHADNASPYAIIETSEKLQKWIRQAILGPKIGLLIWGAPGIGKTAIVTDVAKEMKDKYPDYQLEVHSLANEDESGFTLPDISSTNKKDFSNLVVSWLHCYKATNDKAKDAELSAACGHGLLFVDELSRARGQVRAVLLGLLQGRSWNEFNLGDGWTIIAATNRMEDDAYQHPIDKTIGSRCRQCWFEPTVDNYIEFAKNNNYSSSLLLDWIKNHDKYYYFDPSEYDENNEEALLANPRSWDNAMRLLASQHKTGTLEGNNILDFSDEELIEILAGFIPSEAISSFVEIIKLIRKLGPIDIIVKNIWEGKDNLIIDKENTRFINLALAQMIMLAHKDNLPTEKEFSNACEWISKQNNSQLAAFFIDSFFRILFPKAEIEIMRKNIFCWKKKEAKLKQENDTNTLKELKKHIDNIFSKWNVTSENIPDYNPGFTKLCTTYKDTFKKYDV